MIIHKSPTRERGLAIARRMKERLRAEGIPVVNVYLFGSLAHGKTHRFSDVDIAVVHEQFDVSRSQERRKVRSLREDYDVPIDIVCLHPEDMENRFLSISREVQTQGIAA